MSIPGVKHLSQNNLLIYMALACFVSAMIFLFFGYGELKLTYDSRDYLRASEKSELYFYGTNHEGHPYINRAPMLYAYLHCFKQKVLAAWWLNTISFIVSLFLVFKIGQSLQFKNIFLFGAVATVAFSYPWLQNHFFLWTEPLFSALILLLVYCLIKNTNLMVIVSIGVLCFFLRKAGIIVMFGSCVYYLVSSQYKSAIISTLIAVIVSMGWFFLELSLVETPPSIVNVQYLIDLPRIYYGDALSSWIFPRLVPLSLRLLLNAILFFLIALYFKSPLLTLMKNTSLQVLIVIFAVYLCSFLLLFGTPEYMEAERFISVLIPLFVLMQFKFVQHLYERATVGQQRVLLFLIFGWMTYPVTRTLSHFL